MAGERKEVQERIARAVEATNANLAAAETRIVDAIDEGVAKIVKRLDTKHIDEIRRLVEDSGDREERPRTPTPVAVPAVVLAPTTGPHPRVEVEAEPDPEPKPRRRRWPRLPSGREALMYAAAIFLLALAGIGLKYFGASLPVVPGLTAPASAPAQPAHAPRPHRGPDAVSAPSPVVAPPPAPSSIDPMVRP